MAGSLVAAKLSTVQLILKEEADMFKTINILQSVMFFATATTALFLNKVGLAVSMLAIGTFVPMLIRRGIAKWRDRLIWTSTP